MTLPVKVTFPITNQNAYEGLFLGEAEELLGKKHFPGVTTLILQAAQRLRSYTINLQLLTQCYTVSFLYINVYLEKPG